MPTTRIPKTFIFMMVLGLIFAISPDLILAQQSFDGGYVTDYTYQETQRTNQPLLFGFATYKLCEIKSALFAIIYILGAIAFVVFAIRALFTKFDLKHFVPIIGSLFIVATADLVIYWISEDAWFCPTAFSQF